MGDRFWGADAGYGAQRKGTFETERHAYAGTCGWERRMHTRQGVRSKPDDKNAKE